jgi:dihydroflavonol-4-reductase
LIGAHLVRALTGAGHQVHCLARQAGRRDGLSELPVTWFLADLLHPGQELDAACAGCDVVFHTAALFSYTDDQQRLNGIAVAGTDAVLRACARQGVSVVVVTSSSVVFGHGGSEMEISETAALASDEGEPAYVAAKIAQHRHALRLGRSMKLDVRLACPTMTIGPTSSQLGPSNGMIVAYLSDAIGCTFAGGCNIVSAADIADGHLLIAAHGRTGESYILGSQNLTWRQIHEMIAELAGVAPPRLHLSHTSAFLAATAEEVRAAIAGRQPLSTRAQAAMIGRHYWYSHAKAAALGFAPRSARQALTETISWLAASPHISREVRASIRLSSEVYHFRSSATEGP